MTSYEEYCPKGLTDETIKFKVADDRDPAPTTPCICGTGSAIGGKEVIQAQADVFKAFGEDQAAKPFQALADGVPAANPHSSAIKQVG